MLGGAGEVGVQAAAGGAHVDCRAVEQPGLLELAEGGVAVAGRAVVIDVQDVGAGGAGGDGQVPVRVTAEPGGDLGWVGGGVAVAVRGGGDLLAGQARQDRPPAGCERQGLAQDRAGHGVLRGCPTGGAGLRAWPQRWVSAWSCSARAGMRRAWNSACAEIRPGVRSGWR